MRRATSAATFLCQSSSSMLISVVAAAMSVDDCAPSDEIRPYCFQPTPQGLGGCAIIPIVTLDRGLIIFWNTSRFRHFKACLGTGHHRAYVFQRYGSDERIKRLELLYRVTLYARSNTVAHNGKEVDENLRAQQTVDLVLVRRIATHQALHCRRFVWRKMVDVQIGIDLRRSVTKSTKRSNAPLLLPVRSPIAHVALGTLIIRVDITE